MAKLILIITALFFLNVSYLFAQSSPEDSKPCTITAEEKSRLLQLDFKSFDQSVSNGGWRKYSNLGCDKIAQELLDDYLVIHRATLEAKQARVILWHSGQISGFLNDLKGAVHRMEQTLLEHEIDPEIFLWNPYVRASIAFLLKDRAQLLLQRQLLAKGISPYNHKNLRIVDSFIRCFNSSYREAYSFTCQPKESNQDRIQSGAIEFKTHHNLPKGLREFFQPKKIILLGEIHGTKEVPALFEKLISAIASTETRTLVALEIPQVFQADIDSFLRTKDSRFLKNSLFFKSPMQDGRGSQAMARLISQVSRLTNVEIFCMDTVDYKDSQDRDSKMALALSGKINSYDHTLVLSGNVHSSLNLGTPWDKNFRPMAYELKSLLPELSEGQIFNALVRFEKLDSWSCYGASIDGCKEYRGKRHKSDYSRAVKFNSYFLLEDSQTDGHLGTFFMRQTKVSLPFARFRL